MASGTIYGTTSNSYITARIKWTSTPDTASNTSTVTATLAYKKDSTYANATYSREFDGSITINGNKKTIDNYYNDRLYLYGNTWKTIASHTVKVEHTSNGSKKITISATGYMDGTSFTSTSCSDTAVLDTIPRASSITSASGVTIGNACSVKWTPLATNFAYKLKFVCGSVSYTTDYITPNTTSAYTYTGYTMAASKWAAAMPKAYSGTCTVTLYTYTSSSSTSAIGSDSATFKLTLSSSVKPTVTFSTPTLVNGWNGYYIQGKSKCTLSATFAAGTGSSISSCSISGTGLTKTGSGTSLSGITNTLTTSGTITYTAKVTDGRSSVSATKSIYVYPYADPTLSISAARTSTSGSVKITYKASCSSINSKNNLVTLKIYQKLSTTSTWPSSATKTVTLSSTSVSNSITLTGLSSTDSYDFKAVVTDTYGSSSKEDTASVLSEFRLLNINKNKKGLALGKMSEDNTFDCGLPMKISTTAATQSDASFNINSTDAKSFMVTRTAMTAGDVRGALYVGDNGSITLRRQETTNGGSFSGNQGYLQVQENQVYTSNAFAAPHGRFSATTDASAFSQNDVALRIGNASGEHIDIDGDEIQAKASATTASGLYINNEGGDVYIGNSNYNGDLYVRNTLNATHGRFISTTDASGTTQANVALRVGNASGEHLDIDGNEIQAKDAAGTPGVLALNFDGGQVTCGGFVVPEIQRGNVVITPSAKNTPTAKVVTFSKTFSGVPTVVATPRTAVPGTTVLGVGAASPSESGVSIYLTRTTTANTGIDWIAVYY